MRTLCQVYNLYPRHLSATTMWILLIDESKYMKLRSLPKYNHQKLPQNSIQQQNPDARDPIPIKAPADVYRSMLPVSSSFEAQPQ